MSDTPVFAVGTLLLYPFRIFFLAASLAALLLMPVWVALLFLESPLQPGIPLMQWHPHEMFSGFVNAAIAGFLLTAVCAWTGSAPLAGAPLAALALLWVAGRAAAWWAPGVSSLWMLVDLAFLPLVAAFVCTPVVRARDWRQLPVLLVLALLWLADVAFHASADPRWFAVLMLLVAALVLVVGGRITPLFSANWLRLRGEPPGVVRTSALLNRATLVAALLTALLEACAVSGLAMAFAASATAVFAGTRLLMWSGWRIRREPLLLVLHLGMLCLVAGYATRALSALGLVADSVWLHAVGVASLGTMIIGVMARVALGHTGRTLRVPVSIALAFWLVPAAGALRVATALGWLAWTPGLLLSAACWVIGFGLFIRYYLPILASPRMDGRTG